MHIIIREIPDAVLDIIYDKQNEYSKEKKRKVSLSQTIAKMITKAYIDPQKADEKRP